LASEQFGRFSFGWYSDTIVDESTGLTPLKSAQHAFAVAESMFGAEGIRGNLYIYGNTGVGKTFLSHCISKEAIDRGLSVLYFSSGEFFDILAGQTFDRKNRGNVVKDLISSCDLLVIDDLGTELTNSFSASSLFRVINDRIVNHKSTIISNNLSLRELSEKYSERILSRITSEYIVLKLTGEDIRILKKLNVRQDSLAEEIHEF
jgi:DNA replication protein DnaC